MADAFVLGTRLYAQARVTTTRVFYTRVTRLARAGTSIPYTSAIYTIFIFLFHSGTRVFRLACITIRVFTTFALFITTMTIAVSAAVAIIFGRVAHIFPVIGAVPIGVALASVPISADAVAVVFRAFLILFLTGAIVAIGVITTTSFISAGTRAAVWSSTT